MRRTVGVPNRFRPSLSSPSVSRTRTPVYYKMRDLVRDKGYRERPSLVRKNRVEEEKKIKPEWKGPLPLGNRSYLLFSLGYRGRPGVQGNSASYTPVRLGLVHFSKKRGV